MRPPLRPPTPSMSPNGSDSCGCGTVIGAVGAEEARTSGGSPKPPTRRVRRVGGEALPRSAGVPLLRGTDDPQTDGLRAVRDPARAPRNARTGPRAAGLRGTGPPSRRGPEAAVRWDASRRSRGVRRRVSETSKRECPRSARVPRDGAPGPRGEAGGRAAMPDFSAAVRVAASRAAVPAQYPSPPPFSRYTADVLDSTDARADS